MKLTTLLSAPAVSAVAAAVLAGPAGSPGVELAFRPGTDTVLQKQLETTLEVRLDDLVLRVDGEEVDPAALGVGADAFVELGYAITATDEYAAFDGARPTELVRTYERLVAWYEDAEGSSDEDRNDLEGERIRFVWNPGTGAYDRTFVDALDPSEEMVQDVNFVSADLDLRAVLPERPVVEGDRWELGADAFLTVLTLGFDFENALRVNEGPEALADVPPVLREELRELVDSLRATCTYRGTVVEGEKALGVIELHGAVEHTLAVDPALLADGERADVEVRLDELSLSLAFELDARCLWDLDEGRLHSVTMEGRGGVEALSEVTVREPGTVLRGSVEVSFDLARDARCESR